MARPGGVSTAMAGEVGRGGNIEEKILSGRVGGRASQSDIFQRNVIRSRKARQCGKARGDHVIPLNGEEIEFHGISRHHYTETNKDPVDAA
jgi:hypothetical protein